MTALARALPLLRCPHCGAALDGEEEVRCAADHSFDVARQGYLSLLAGGGSAHRGDTAEMVAARERVLAAGCFEPLAQALGEAVAEAEEGAVLDLGAGTAWYLARLLDRAPDALGIALDVSKPALRRAARAHPRAAAVACDAWGQLPVRDGVAAVVLNLFAPRNGAEVARVLAPGGLAIVVTPTAEHLRELRQPLGLLDVGPDKDRLPAELELVDRRELEWAMRLDPAAARDVAAMGPSAFHVAPAALDERVAGLPQSLDVTAAVAITLARAAEPRARPPAPAAGACDPDRPRTRPATRPPRSPGGTG